MASSKVSVGTGRLSADDFVAIVCGGASVELDSAALGALQRALEGRPDKSVRVAAEAITAEMTDDSDGGSLTFTETRAAVLGKLLALLQGRSFVRAEVCEFLANALNSRVLPLLPRASERVAAAAVADFACGVGLAYSADGTGLAEAAEALAAVRLAPPGLTEAEAGTLRNLGVSCSAGVGFLAAAKAAYAVPLADTAAAMSCEAFAAFTAPFEYEHTDVARPHKHSSAVAANMRTLLEGSRRCNSRSVKEEPQDPACFRCIAHIHGGAGRLVDEAARALRIEAHAAEVGAFSSQPKSAGPFSDVPLTAALEQLVQGASLLSSVSVARVTAVTSPPSSSAAVREDTLVLTDFGAIAADTEMHAASAEVSSGSGVDALPVAQATLRVVEALGRVLAAEMRVSAAFLHHEDARARAANEEKQRQKQARAVEAITAKLEKLGKTTEEIEAEIAKQRARDAEKAAKKSSGPGTALVLGAGVTSALSLLPPLDTAARDDGAWRDAFTLESPKLARALQHVFESLQSRRKPKIAKGTRDFLPGQMRVRELAFSTIQSVFQRHGAVTIDTPVFELRETLMGKYGEDSKLIYDLADQGGELLSLRYDLTVPFARYVAMHNIANIKRYHIAKVYRRDNPAMNRGRFREFYQCDFDIAGTYGRMIPDSEVIKVVTEILDGLDIGSYVLKLNHRGLLDAMLEICGCPAEKFRPICSAIDKLDKESWEDVRAEMVDQKGLDPEAADRIGKLVVHKGAAREMMALLAERKYFDGHKGARKALDDLEFLFGFLEAMGCLDRISFDLSLARGLDYYTGVIYEAVLTETDKVGSIAAGGRYDHLVGMFNASGKDVPAVGVSIGIERVFAIMEDRIKERNEKMRETYTEVLVASAGGSMLADRMRLANELWSAGVKAEFLPVEKPNMKKQLEYVLDHGIPLMAVIGEDEVANGTVNLKVVSTKLESSVERASIVDAVRNALAQLHG